MPNSRQVRRQSTGAPLSIVSRTGHRGRLRTPRQACTCLLFIVILCVAPTLARAETVVYQASKVWSDNTGLHHTTQLWRTTTAGGSGTVIPNTTNAYWPALSPDGTKLAYVVDDSSAGAGDGDLYVSNIDGTGKQLIYGADWTSQPSWAPDGKSLVFTKDVADNRDIYRINMDGTGLAPVAAWAGAQDWASFSPDGRRLVLTSQHSDPSGLGPNGLYVADANGQNVTLVAAQDQGSKPDWSVTGRIVYAGPFYDVYTVNPDGSGEQTLTNVPVGQEWTDNPKWSSDGTKIAFDDSVLGAASGTIQIMNGDGSGRTSLVGAPPGDATGVCCASFPKGSARAFYQLLLARYRPALFYNQGESFFADRANEQTDWATRTYGDRLLRGDGISVIAQTVKPKNGSGIDQLSLGYLGYPRYATGKPVQVSPIRSLTDFLDEPGNNSAQYTSDYQSMTAANPDWRNNTYARLVEDAAGKWWLQYWLYYYYNPQSAGFTNTGVHEGDWEMVQYGLGSDGTPDVAVYAQHTGKEVCPWSAVYQVGGFPAVFVARGSHASYFQSGTTGRGVLPDDVHSGDYPGGAQVVNSTEVADASPAWILWPGFWGGSQPAGDYEDSSPTGPSQHGQQWEDPNAWANDDPTGCTVSMAGRTHRDAVKPPIHKPRPIVPAPRIHAKRERRFVRVWYTFKKLGRGRRHRAVALQLTVLPANPRRNAPTTVWRRVRHRTGIARVRIPVGRGPYTLQVFAQSRTTAQSRVITIHLG